MHRRAVIAGTAALGALAGSADAASGLEGEWLGLIDYDTPVRLIIAPGRALRLRAGPPGSAADYSARVEALTPADVRFAIAGLSLSFAGRLSAQGRIEGELRQLGRAYVAAAFSRDAAPPLPPPSPLNEALVERLRAESGVPALAIAAQRGSGPPLLWSAGVRSAGAQARATAGDCWVLASITKPMTATLIARLAEAGRLTFDDRIGDVLGAAEAGPYRDLNFRHLLCHRAGLPHEAGGGADRARAARSALSRRPLGPAERTYQYSNAGYVVAAAMVEVKTGQRWEDLMRREVFGPLALSSAAFGPPRPGDPQGHPRGRPARQRFIDEAYYPGGGVRMSLPDLLVFLAAHRDSTAFLRPASWTVLHTPPFGGAYAMGWDIFADGRIGHGGALTFGWTADAQIDRERGTVSAAAVNAYPGFVVSLAARRAGTSV